MKTFALDQAQLAVPAGEEDGFLKVA